MRLIFIIIFTVLLTGCGGYNQLECYQAVADKYPNSDIRELSGIKYRFLVRTPEGEVRYVTTLNLNNTEISADITMFK